MNYELDQFADHLDLLTRERVLAWYKVHAVTDKPGTRIRWICTGRGTGLLTYALGANVSIERQDEGFFALRFNGLLVNTEALAGIESIAAGLEGSHRRLDECRAFVAAWLAAKDRRDT